MAKQANSSSYQVLGKGIYRVGAVRRSAVTGRYVTKNTATTSARTTVGESKNSGVTAKNR